MEDQNHHRKNFLKNINGFEDGNNYFSHCKNPSMVKANNYHEWFSYISINGNLFNNNGK